MVCKSVNTGWYQASKTVNANHNSHYRNTVLLNQLR